MTDETTNVEPVETTGATPVEETTQPEATQEAPTVKPVAEEIPAQEAPKTDLPFVSKLTNLSELRAGQTVRVHERIKDLSPKGEVRERIQVFKGMITSVKGSKLSRTMTIRKVSEGGYGVEKIYPVNSPVIAKIELVKTARVRRAKLNFLTNVKKRFKRKFKETYMK